MTQDYTRGAETPLPSGTTNLDTGFTAGDYTAVSTDDNSTYVAQGASAGEFAIFQFKDSAVGKTGVTITWDGQTDVAPSDQTVYLEIYNTNSSVWEAIDSDSTTGADTDFNLQATVPNLTNYLDGSNIVTCRVFQFPFASLDLQQGSYLELEQGGYLELEGV